MINKLHNDFTVFKCVSFCSNKFARKQRINQMHLKIPPRGITSTQQLPLKILKQQVNQGATEGNARATVATTKIL